MTLWKIDVGMNRKQVGSRTKRIQASPIALKNLNRDTNDSQ